MERIAQLFDQMDVWRHLPNYQLERRADLFFSLYLPEVLEAKLGLAFRPDLIPEFPVRIGTIYPKIETNLSFKIDYLALSASSEQAVFVELKTEGRSRRSKQDRYLAEAQEVGLAALLDGLLRIFKATQAKRKYFRLLQSLGRLGLLEIPSSMHEIIASDRLQGLNEMCGDVRITCPVKQCKVIYVQPTGTGPDTISFDEFQVVVARHPDALSTRFAQSLKEWATIPASKPSSNQ